MNSLPGIEALFREHRRLANKLTKEEMKGLKTYMTNRLMQDHGALLVELENVRSEKSAKVQEMQDEIDELTSELQFKNELLHQYKSSDESLAHVHKQREQRLEHKQSELELDLEKNQASIHHLKDLNEELRIQLRDKDGEIDRLQLVIEELERKVESTRDILESDADARTSKLSKEVLKLKLDIDAKNRQCQKMAIEMHNMEKEMEELKKLAMESKTKADNLADRFNQQGRDLVSKSEQVIVVQHQLDHEKKKLAELQKESLFHHGPAVRRLSADNSDSELSRIHGEYFRAQIQFIESRVKLLEEKIAMYRNEIRSVTQEITMITEDVSKSTQLCERLVVHGNTVVEKILKELCDNIRRRKDKLNVVLDDIIKTVPNITSRDACELRADTLSLKKIAETHRIHDVGVRASRVLTRIENCEKAQFTSKFVSSNTPLAPTVQNDRIRVVNDIRVKRQDTFNGNNESKNNRKPEVVTNGVIHTEDSVSKMKLSPRKQDVVNGNTPTEARVFTFTNRKPTTNGTLLSRPKNVHGNSVALWRRKHSVSMDTPCLSPTLIDLGMTSPLSPREKKMNFPHSLSMSMMESRDEETLH